MKLVDMIPVANPRGDPLANDLTILPGLILLSPLKAVAARLGPVEIPLVTAFHIP